MDSDMNTSQPPASLSPSTRDMLARVSTATLSTALFKRGLRNAFLSGVGALNPRAPRMVGEAFTLRYIPAREDLDRLEVFENWEHPQRKAVETIPPGRVMVIDSRNDARSASAGGILITRMMKRGAAGIVTDGGFRDTPDMRTMPFPVYCRVPAAPTNLIHHHAVDINVPIGCAGVPVYPGDVVVGDAEGVIVVPAYLAQEVAEEALQMTVFEDFVMEQVEGGAGIFGLYPPSPEARQQFSLWRAAKSR